MAFDHAHERKGEDKMKNVIVIPAHARTNHFLSPEFISAVAREAELDHADVIIVDDSDGNLGVLPPRWRIYGYEKQKEFLGELYDDFNKLFHKQAACRVFGHILAYAEGYDVVIGLDSDCVLRPDFIYDHAIALERKGVGWTNPLNDTHLYSRGFPYSMRGWKVVANMGLWNGVLDLNGKDRMEDDTKQVLFNDAINRVAVAPLPFSGMNFALSREAISGFLFIPAFDFLDEEFRRMDDIWGGYIFQKLARKLHQGVTYGYPIIEHVSEINAEEDARDEAAMIKYESQFYREVDIAMRFHTEPEDTYISLFEKFFNQFAPHASPQFFNMLEGIAWWLRAWKKYGK